MFGPAIGCAALVVVALAAGCGSSGSSKGGTGSATTPASSARQPPSDGIGPRCGTAAAGASAISHVVWILMENKSFDQVIGTRSAPFINRLAAQCGLATNFTAETHPSLPNYIALISGGTHGIRDDDGPGAHPVRGPSIFSQLGTGWRTLAESMGSNCSGSNSSRYLARHNPAVYFTNARTQCLKQDVPLGAAPDVSARFTFIVPNTCNDMHDCGVKTGDAWLSKWLPKLFATPQYRSNTTAIFLTWDEDDGGPMNHVPTIVVSPSTARGTKSGAHFTHYSMLRTTQELLGLQPLLGHAKRAPSMRAAFGL